MGPYNDVMSIAFLVILYKIGYSIFNAIKQGVFCNNNLANIPIVC